MTATKEQLLELAKKWDEASWGKVALGDEDLQLLGIEPQKTFKSTKYGTINVSDGWESFCAFVFEKLTGTPHPGSQARGRGFRSRHFGEVVSEEIRKRAV